MFDEFLDNMTDEIFESDENSLDSVTLYNENEDLENSAESLLDSENFLTVPIDDLQPVTILVALIVVILIFQTIVRAFKGNS